MLAVGGQQRLVVEREPAGPGPRAENRGDSRFPVDECSVAVEAERFELGDLHKTRSLMSPAYSKSPRVKIPKGRRCLPEGKACCGQLTDAQMARTLSRAASSRIAAWRRHMFASLAEMSRDS